MQLIKTFAYVDTSIQMLFLGQTTGSGFYAMYALITLVSFFANYSYLQGPITV